MNLITELIWYQRYITEHDLESQIEIQDDKLVVYWNNLKPVQWSVNEANAFRNLPKEKLVPYCINTICDRFELVESMIYTDANLSRWYAKDVLKGPFKRGEPAIAASLMDAGLYASWVLNGRFELGEPMIATDAHQSRWYAEYVLSGRFELGEPVIATDAVQSLLYKLFLDKLKISYQASQQTELDQN